MKLIQLIRKLIPVAIVLFVLSCIGAIAFLMLPSQWTWLAAVAVLLAVGQWVDLYVEIFPGSVIHPTFGIIEIGSYLGFTGLFALFVGYILSKAALVAKNHPLIEESYSHHFESYI